MYVNNMHFSKSVQIELSFVKSIKSCPFQNAHLFYAYRKLIDELFDAFERIYVKLSPFKRHGFHLYDACNVTVDFL